MKTIPHLIEADIRPRSSDRSWARGQDYYYGSCVENVIWRDGFLTAEVQGSEYEPYIVQVRFDGKKIRSTDCTCPYDWGGDCKHIIAVLLYLCHRRDDIEQRPALADLIANLNREQLAELIIDLSVSYPAILDHFERNLPLVVSGESASSTPESAQLDTKLLRRQIKAELRASIKSGYDSWGEEAFYDSNLSVALEPALAQVQSYLDQGKPRTALAILETATIAWEDGIYSLDNYVRNSFEDVADEFTFELGRMWAETLLMADLSSEERQQWQEKLEEIADTIYGLSLIHISEPTRPSP